MLLAAALLHPAGPARAAGSLLLEPEGRPLCTGGMAARVPRVALPDGAGGHLVVAEDANFAYNFPYAEWEVTLLRLGPDLAPIPVPGLFRADSPCGAVLIGGDRIQSVRAALPIDPGAFLVTGSDARTGVYAAFARAFDASGAPLFAEPWPALSDPVVPAVFPIPAPDGRGGFFVAWAELIETPGLARLVLQRLDGRGVPQWPRPRVIAPGPYVVQSSISVAADGEGGLYLAWDESRDDDGSAGYRLRLQRVGPEGEALWADGGLRVYDGDTGPDAILVTDGAAGVIVVFAGGPLRAQKLSRAGARLWGAAGVALSDGRLVPRLDAPRVTAAPEGFLYVSWTAWTAESDAALLVVRLERDGSLPWPGPVAVVSHPDGAWFHDTAIVPGGSLGLAWEDLRFSAQGDYARAYAQVIDARGRVKGASDGLALAAAPGVQFTPLVLPGPPTADPAAPVRLGAVWADTRFASPFGTFGPPPALSYVVQAAAFTSEPRLDPAPAAALLQSEAATLVLPGDDLDPGAAVDAGPGVVVEEMAVRPLRDRGPGDLLTLRVRAGAAAAPGPRDIVLANPDGGRTRLEAALAIALDARRIDLDASGRVDGFDLALLAGAFGRPAGDPRYDRRADIDVSGLVDGADLALLASRFGGQIGSDRALPLAAAVSPSAGRAASPAAVCAASPAAAPCSRRTT